MLQDITAAMCWGWLCAPTSSAIPFPLLSSTSGIELQHIIGTSAGRRPTCRLADCGAGGCRQTIVAIGSHDAKPARITRRGVRRPRSGKPVGRSRYLRRARLRAPRGDDSIMCCVAVLPARKTLVTRPPQHIIGPSTWEGKRPRVRSGRHPNVQIAHILARCPAEDGVTERDFRKRDERKPGSTSM